MVLTILEVRSMINQSTITKLNEMRLTAMADSYKDQITDTKYQELSFEERLGLMGEISNGPDGNQTSLPV